MVEFTCVHGDVTNETGGIYMNTNPGENKLLKKLLPVLLLTLIMGFCLSFTGCGDDEEVTDDDIDFIMNEEGMEDSTKADPKKIAKAKALNQSAESFIGKWSATSSEAQNLYGNLEITINEDGTFEGNVTDEDISGTWTKTDKGISYKCDLMGGSMYYGDHGKMVIEDNENGDVKVVMNKVNLRSENSMSMTLSLA